MVELINFFNDFTGNWAILKVVFYIKKGHVLYDKNARLWNVLDHRFSQGLEKDDRVCGRIRKAFQLRDTHCRKGVQKFAIRVLLFSVHQLMTRCVEPFSRISSSARLSSSPTGWRVGVR